MIPAAAYAVSHTNLVQRQREDLCLHCPCSGNLVNRFLTAPFMHGCSLSIRPLPKGGARDVWYSCIHSSLQSVEFLHEACIWLFKWCDRVYVVTWWPWQKSSPRHDCVAFLQNTEKRNATLTFTIYGVRISVAVLNTFLARVTSPCILCRL